MIKTHCFVSLIDVDELLPLVPHASDDVREHLEDEKRLKDELERFVTLLSKNLNEKIYYLGNELVAKKSYQEFMFHGTGFMEISGDVPIAISAHFHSKKRAKKFAAALKKTLKSIISPSAERKMLLSSIDVKDEHEESLVFQKWSEMHDARGLLQRSLSLVIISTAVFLVIEFGKALFTELFSGIFGIHQIFAVILIAIVIALLFKPLERVIDSLLAKFLFR